jgi:hypothetical protein
MRTHDDDDLKDGKEQPNDDDWKYSSVLERVIDRQIRLKAFGEPKKTLLWLGIQLAQFSRRVAHEPRKECRNVLGKETCCNVYPRWWWEEWGDDQVVRHLAEVKERPDVLAAVKEHADYSERCRMKVEEMKQDYKSKKEDNG